MRWTLVMPTLAVLTAALAAPASARYEGAYGPRHYGSTYYGTAYRHRIFRGAYNEGPAIGPLFYNGGWVPEPIFDHSRPGGIDPYIRPPP